MELILVRHPEVDLPAGTCYGQADVAMRAPMAPPLDQVRAALAAHEPLTALAGSPLQRARGLAQALSVALACPLWPADARWMELDFGSWEGRPWSAIPRAESDPWAEDPLHRAPPGGESLAMLATRVHAAMDAAADALAAAGGERLAVVAHAGPIRIARARALGHDIRQAADPALAHPLPFGGLTPLRATRRDGHWHWSLLP
jgi:alpha-ribazole phosphatase